MVSREGQQALTYIQVRNISGKMYTDLKTVELPMRPETEDHLPRPPFMG